MTTSEALPDMSRALIFEPTTGDWLVAALGGRLGVRKVGAFGKHAGSIVTLIGKTLKKCATLKVAKEQIGDMAFTSNGKILAVASNDQFIYLIHVKGPTKMDKFAKCSGHSSYVTDISISEDNKWMMTNDGAGELLFWNVQTGEREPDADEVKNALWNPNTCPLSWETIGIWGASDDLTDINAIEVCDELDLIVTADDAGTYAVVFFVAVGMRCCDGCALTRLFSSFLLFLVSCSFRQNKNIQCTGHFVFSPLF